MLLHGCRGDIDLLTIYNSVLQGGIQLGECNVRGARPHNLHGFINYGIPAGTDLQALHISHSIDGPIDGGKVPYTELAGTYDCSGA